MTTNHKPATPLPWKQDESTELPPGVIADTEDGLGVAEVTDSQDAAYIAHAANAYPRLVEEAKALRAALQQFHAARSDIQNASVRYGTPTYYGALSDAGKALASPLLRELGEDA